jgi:dTDP-4-amino-4,6-dideoxygalactose transaminase
LLLINDLGRHHSTVRECVGQAIERVLARGWFILGPEVEAFEAEFAAYCGVRHCAGVANGTDALELALRASGIKAGDRVATVANAGMYSTTAILACGAIPVYAEIEPLTMLMDPARIPKADAVIVTHLYGRMARMPEVLQAAPGVPVIEDCAQAHGAVLDGRKAGAWGAMGCFSFYPTKNLGALGDGGAVVTNDSDVDKRLRALRQYGWTSKYTATVRGGRNSRLDEMQAAILRAKLPLLDGWNARRRAIAAQYGMVARGGLDDVAHLYVIRTTERERVRTALREQGIGVEVHYPIPDYKQEAVGISAELPETERACAEVLTLPCFPEMTDGEVERVKQSVETSGARTES